MAPLVPDANRIHSFRDVKAFEAWFSANHDREPDLWARIFRKGSDVATVTAAEALDVALCWGWIDGIRKGFDESSYLQRYTPRRARSTWSQVNRGHVARLTAARPAAVFIWLVRNARANRFMMSRSVLSESPSSAPTSSTAWRTAPSARDKSVNEVHGLLPQ